MLFSYKNTAHINKKDILATAKSLESYINHLRGVAGWNNYQFYESSINLPLDEALLTYVMRLKKTLVTPKLKYIIDIGIGGSNLGTKAIYDAIYGYFDIIEGSRHPKIIFADTNDSEYLHKLQKFLQTIEDPEEVILNAVSKSGTTTEAIANLEILLSKAKNFKHRLVVTTNFDSELWQQSLEQDVNVLPIPEKVGGRYSVFSSVGLFPLACAGLDIVNLLDGAMDMRLKCLNPDVLQNPAVLSATALFLNYKNGKVINDNFYFHPELESLGKWYRQLMGESIGKDGVGITPTVSIGSTDLHSMGQLYLGGPKDKFFTFVSSLGHAKAVKIPTNSPFPLTLTEIKGKTTEEIMNAIYEGVKVAYEKHDLPYVEIQLQNIDERSIGKYMMLKMIEMMLLGKLLGVNAFDQPNVESYKVETRKILTKA